MRFALNSDRREIDADPRIQLLLGLREVPTAVGSASVRFAFVRSPKGGRHGCQYTLLGSIAIEDDAVGQNNAYRSTRVSGMAARL